MSISADSAEYRLTRYRSLQRRNRLVGILRIGVPALGLIVFVAMAVQIFVTGMVKDLGLGTLTIDRNVVNLEAPQLGGVLEDGSVYRVVSEGAKMLVGQPDVIDLTNAAVVLDRFDGVQMQATAAAAQLHTQEQVVDIPGRTEVSDSTGMNGTLQQTNVDWTRQVLSTKGKVDFVFADGSRLDAATMIHDTGARTWTFTNVHVSLPITPGEELP